VLPGVCTGAGSDGPQADFASTLVEASAGHDSLIVVTASPKPDKPEHNLPGGHGPEIQPRPKQRFNGLAVPDLQRHAEWKWRFQHDFLCEPAA